MFEINVKKLINLRPYTAILYLLNQYLGLFNFEQTNTFSSINTYMRIYFFKFILLWTLF